MICQDYLTLFCDFIDKRLSEEQEKAIKEHCSQCRECALAWKELIENSEKIRNLRRFSVSASFVLDVMSHLEKKQSMPIMKIPTHPIFALAACILLCLTIITIFQYKESALLSEEKKIAVLQENYTKEQESDLALSRREKNKEEGEEYEIMEDVSAKELGGSFPEEKPSPSFSPNMPQRPIASSSSVKEKMDVQKSSKKANYSMPSMVAKNESSSLNAISPFALQAFLKLLSQDKLSQTAFLVFSSEKEKAKGIAHNKPIIEIAMVSLNISQDQKVLSSWLKLPPNAMDWEWQNQSRKVWLFQGEFIYEEIKKLLDELEKEFLLVSKEKEADKISLEDFQKKICLMLWVLE